MSTYADIPSVASDETRRATGEATVHRASHPVRFSAKQKTEGVRRLLRGEDLDRLARACGVPASRIATWREPFLEAGHESMKKPPAAERDRARSRLREKLGESALAMELLNEQIERLETARPVGRRRARHCARPARPPQAPAMGWLAPAAWGVEHAPPSPGSLRTPLRPDHAQGLKAQGQTTSWGAPSGRSCRPRRVMAQGIGRAGHACGRPVCGPRLGGYGV
jgi:hypothetical protein